MHRALDNHISFAHDLCIKHLALADKSAAIYGYIWLYTLSNLYFGCLDLYFGCLDLYFGCPDLFWGVCTCIWVYNWFWGVCVLVGCDYGVRLLINKKR